MINGLRVLAIVPARGGSKTLPRKNLAAVGGRSLIEHALRCARESQFVDRTVLSSEDNEILSLGAALPFDECLRRDAGLAEDDTPMIEVILDVIDREAETDLVVLLQPTSPMRTGHDIDRALELVARGAPACVSVTAAAHHPFWMLVSDRDGKLKPVVEAPEQYGRRQDLPPAWVLNGAVYVATASWLTENRGFIGNGTVGYPMPASRAIDIDSAEDLEQARSLAKDPPD